MKLDPNLKEAGNFLEMNRVWKGFDAFRGCAKILIMQRSLEEIRRQNR